MVCYVHQVPGRIRVKVPHLKARQNCCGKLEKALRNIHGVEDSKVNPVTGSVVVHYDKSRASADSVLEVLKANQYYDENLAQPADKYAQSFAADAGAKVGKVLFGWAVSKALEANGLRLLSVLI